MDMSRVQFQPGLSLPAFQAQFVAESVNARMHLKRHVVRKAFVVRSAATRITTCSRVVSIRHSNASAAGNRHP
jgi:hypothetical protein